MKLPTLRPLLIAACAIIVSAGWLSVALADAWPTPTPTPLPSRPPSGPPSLTLRSAVELYQSIKALDAGGMKIVDGKETHVPFQFSGATRWALRLNLIAVKDQVEAENSTKDSIIADCMAKEPKDEQPMIMQTKVQAAADKQLDPILNAAVDPAPVLKKIPFADLQPDTNPIPVGVLEGLTPILTE